jgi:dsDNA-specific endonuclease/ATPase MutS2
MKFSLGETVSIMTETGIFTVRRIESMHLWLEDEHGFERRIPTSHVVKRQAIETTVKVKDGQTQENPKAKGLTRTNKTHEVPSIDLHAGSLGIESYQPQEMLNLQLDACKVFLNQCIRKRVVKLVIIHGIGDGTLRHAVRQMLAGKKGIQFHDGNFSARGVGSTLVEIQLNSITPF